MLLLFSYQCLNHAGSLFSQQCDAQVNVDLLIVLCLLHEVVDGYERAGAPNSGTAHINVKLLRPTRVVEID